MAGSAPHGTMSLTIMAAKESNSRLPVVFSLFVADTKCVNGLL
jgi:hypothetical protein